MITANLTGNLGNHMWNYVIARIVAEKLGYEWGVPPYPIYDYHNGDNQMYFMNVDFGKPVKIIGKDKDGLNKFEGQIHTYRDKHKGHIYNGDSCIINMYDPDVFNIEDNTMIHVMSQSEDYLIDRRSDVISWFLIKDEHEKEYQKKMIEMGISLDDNTCVINFRGGEYKSVPNLIPNQSYWKNCINYMKGINPNMKFIIFSDDPQCAGQFIPGIPCYHIDIGFDFYMVNKAKYLIIANSSFSWWASWLNQNAKLILAPKYFGRHNVSNGYWSQGDSYTSQFTYMGRDGVVSDYNTCKKEALEFYKINNL